MARMNRAHAVVAAFALLALGAASTAQAQSAKDKPWSVEFGIGWDNGISGNINASGIGQINNQVVVITKNSYEDVYGTGLHIRFGGGYMLTEATEARVTFTFQSLDADFVTPMGDIGVSNLYGQYSDYQTFGIDFGLRRYADLPLNNLRLYGEATVGVGFVDKTDVTLVAPGANLVQTPSSFYDQTTAFTAGINVGVLAQANPTVGFFAQLGLHYVTGMSQVDQFIGTGLDNINDSSARWTAPFIGGIRFRF